MWCGATYSDWFSRMERSAANVAVSGAASNVLALVDAPSVVNARVTTSCTMDAISCAPTRNVRIASVVTRSWDSGARECTRALASSSYIVTHKTGQPRQVRAKQPRSQPTTHNTKHATSHMRQCRRTVACSSGKSRALSRCFMDRGPTTPRQLPRSLSESSDSDAYSSVAESTSSESSESDASATRVGWLLRRCEMEPPLDRRRRRLRACGDS